jgi:hypothetical protein
MGAHRGPWHNLEWVGDWLAYMLLRVLMLALLLAVAAAVIVALFVITAYTFIFIVQHFAEGG